MKNNNIYIYTGGRIEGHHDLNCKNEYLLYGITCTLVSTTFTT
jgi:hypothetical protein